VNVFETHCALLKRVTDTKAVQLARYTEAKSIFTNVENDIDKLFTTVIPVSTFLESYRFLWLFPKKRAVKKPMFLHPTGNPDRMLIMLRFDRAILVYIHDKQNVLAGLVDVNATIEEDLPVMLDDGAYYDSSARLLEYILQHVVQYQEV